MTLGSSSHLDATARQRVSTVAMVTFNWLSVGGGVTKYVAGLTDHLRRRTDLRIVIIAADPRAADDGVVVSGSGLGLAWSTWRALRRVRPQVIHCHGHIWMGAASAAYKWSRGGRCALIYSLHTKIESPDRAHPGSWRGRLSAVVRRIARRALHALIVRHSDAVTAVSKAMADDLTAVDRVRPRAKIEVVPPGVEISEPTAREVQAFRERYGLVGKFPIIVSIGLLHYPWKVEGHECLISALAILRVRYPEARLVLVGDGRYRKRVERSAAEAGVGDRVIVTGYLDAPGRALAVADVYGHLATNEAFGIAIVEAMLFGKPVVAADRGGIPEVITHQETGLLIAPQPDAVAEAIARVLENREWGRALGERARHAASRAYTWESAVERFAAMYGGAVTR
jgi:glycosyltransferase involved in cell wall biosynthesis